MNQFDFTWILALISTLAGLVGSMSGLGGGIILVPFLVLGSQIDTHFAVGASLIGVIATSLGGSLTYIDKGVTHIRSALFFLIASTFGAIVGAYTAHFLEESHVQMIFGTMLLLTVLLQRLFPKNEDASSKAHSIFSARPPMLHPFQALGLFIISGGFSGLLGIGSGSLNVLILEKVVRFPLKVATATSNYMIGITATASAGAFFHMGHISPPLVLPVVPGVLLGSYLGSLILLKVRAERLRVLFQLLVVALSVQMLLKGVL